VNKIIETIRALRMKTQANGCTGPEEIAAQAKAQEMMTAHEITEADLTEAKPGWLEEFFNNIFTRDDRAEGAWERYLRAQGTWENYEQYRRKKQGDQQKRKEEQRAREQGIDQAWADRDRKLYDRLMQDDRRIQNDQLVRDQSRDEREDAHWNFTRTYNGRWHHEWKRGKEDREKTIKRVRKMWAESDDIEGQATVRAAMDYHGITEVELILFDVDKEMKKFARSRKGTLQFPGELWGRMKKVPRNDLRKLIVDQYKLEVSEDFWANLYGLNEES
jgi:hypothetical protein